MPNETPAFDFTPNAAELARHWEAMTPEQQKAFLEELGCLLEVTDRLIKTMAALNLPPPH